MRIPRARQPVARQGRIGLSVLCLLALLALVGCETVPQPDVVEPADVVVGAPPLEVWVDGGMDLVEVRDDLPPLPPPDDDPILQVLVGELAAVRGDATGSLAAYLRASELAGDPRLAAYATRAALALQRDDLALQAARQWAAQSPAQVDALRMLGLLSLRQGEIEQAVDALGRLLALDPALAEPRMEQLDARLARETDQRSVVDLLDRLTERHPEMVAAWVALARAALRVGDGEVAAAAALQALERDFGNRQLRAFYGQVLIETDQVDAAILVFQQLAVDYPEDVDVRFQLASVLIGADRPDDALAEFDDLLGYGVVDPDTLYNIGLLAVEADRLVQARRYFERLLAQDDEAGAVRFILGRIAEDLGDTAAALEWYAQVDGEEAAPAALRRAGLLADSDDLPAARDALQALRLADPDRAVTAFLFEAQLLREAGEYREGIALMDAALTRHPGTIDLFYSRALLSVFLGEIADAERDLRRILERDPDHAHALNALGYTLVDRTDRLVEGYVLIRRALALEPESPAILDSMGWALFRLGRHDEALPYLEQAWALMVDGEIGAHLGEVLWVLGRFEEARTVWAAAEQADPGHPVLIDTLQRLDPAHPVMRQYPRVRENGASRPLEVP